MDLTIQNYSISSNLIKLNCLKFYQWAMENNLKSFRMVIADDKYYEKTLQERRKILNAPTTSFLCKTIVFQNTAYDQKFAGPHYPKYIAVLVQYVAKIQTEKLNKTMRLWQQNHNHEKASKQYFHFRLAQESISSQLTGYEHNGVIPILMKTNIPVVVSHHIKSLKPEFFWMGGGHPEVKMRLSFAQFKLTYPNQVLVDDITY